MIFIFSVLSQFMPVLVFFSLRGVFSFPKLILLFILLKSFPFIFYLLTRSLYNYKSDLKRYRRAIYCLWVRFKLYINLKNKEYFSGFYFLLLKNFYQGFLAIFFLSFVLIAFPLICLNNITYIRSFSKYFNILLYLAIAFMLLLLFYPLLSYILLAIVYLKDLKKRVIFRIRNFPTQLIFSITVLLNTFINLKLKTPSYSTLFTYFIIKILFFEYGLLILILLFCKLIYVKVVISMILFFFLIFVELKLLTFVGIKTFLDSFLQKLTSQSLQLIKSSKQLFLVLLQITLDDLRDLDSKISHSKLVKFTTTYYFTPPLRRSIHNLLLLTRWWNGLFINIKDFTVSILSILSVLLTSILYINAVIVLECTWVVIYLGDILLVYQKAFTIGFFFKVRIVWHWFNILFFFYFIPFQFLKPVYPLGIVQIVDFIDNIRLFISPFLTEQNLTIGLIIFFIPASIQLSTPFYNLLISVLNLTNPILLKSIKFYFKILLSSLFFLLNILPYTTLVFKTTTLFIFLNMFLIPLILCLKIQSYLLLYFRVIYLKLTNDQLIALFNLYFIIHLVFYLTTYL